jgi:hypothetical protein
LFKRVRDLADGVGPRIDEFCSAVPRGRKHARAKRHATVRRCRTVLDNENALAGYRLRIGHI